MNANKLTIMHWALAVVVVAVVVLMASNSARRLPWINKMRRLHQNGGRADWMAPDHVIQKVQNDYAAAVNWMQDSPSQSFPHQWRDAVSFLSGPFLRRYQQILLRQRTERPAPVYGILRADHALEICGFSQDGRRCWLIDHQHGRRMATYDANTHERLLTQDLGDGAVVYTLLYDMEADQWKIDALLQELPAGWGHRKHLNLVPELALPVRRIGRDA